MSQLGWRANKNVAQVGGWEGIRTAHLVLHFADAQHARRARREQQTACENAKTKHETAMRARMWKGRKQRCDRASSNSAARSTSAQRIPHLSTRNHRDTKQHAPARGSPSFPCAGSLSPAKRSGKTPIRIVTPYRLPGCEPAFRNTQTTHASQRRL